MIYIRLIFIKPYDILASLMEYHFLFLVKEGSAPEEAIAELEGVLDNLYELCDPDTGAVQIGGYSNEKDISNAFTHSILEIASQVEEIDWQKQWADFAPGFEDGLSHIDLGGPILLLQPGAGFGDLSHPTTRLALELMKPIVKGATVFDIGCGSGILSLAAILLGAKACYGIDIDPEAVKHSQANAQVNQVEGKTHFSTDIDPSWLNHEPVAIVMNMIETEQVAAWQASPLLHSKAAHIVTSGILSSQRQQYLALAKGWGWTLLEEGEEEGWSGFVFFQGQMDATDIQ